MLASTVKPKQARRSNKPSSDLAGRSLNALATFSKSDFRAVKIKTCEEVKKNDKLLKFVLNDGSGEEMLNLLLVDDRIPAGAKLY